MHIERCFVPGLAHASYMIVSDCEAVVLDPERNVDGYLAYLAANNLELRYIVLTHPHADFVAGHAELSARSGAPILLSELAPATFPHGDLKDGDRITAGNVEIEVIATPGHSPDSICLCLFESGDPMALFSGDTLFAGDVGRTDLRDLEVAASKLAAMLYDSLFHKVLRLPQELKVYPAHGAGALCGRQICSAPFTTIGQEAESNWALQLNDRACFIEAMVANLPERPPYSERLVAINLRGGTFLSDLPSVPRLRLSEFDALKQKGATILDVRPGALFGNRHAEGSLNVGIANPSFAVWSGFLVNPDLPIALVVDYETDAHQAQLELARIGFDQVVGFVTADDLDETQQITQIEAHDFLASLERPRRPVILDVRSPSEWSGDGLEDSINIPLPQLIRRIGELSREAHLIVLCEGGYRSSIAVSLLRAEGFEQLSNLAGGIQAVREVSCC